ncbi:MAG: hypothetical protein D6730_15740 [Bacteroidetes bacterium]|nr:MAG: hypothetical protein D6730_15740 [Bacteroidota bacterium]
MFKRHDSNKGQKVLNIKVLNIIDVQHLAHLYMDTSTAMIKLWRAATFQDECFHPHFAPKYLQSRPGVYLHCIEIYI